MNKYLANYCYDETSLMQKFWIIFYVVGRQLRAQQHLLLILHLGSLRLLLPHPLDPIYVIIHCKGLQN